ncbi:TPA: hypothetical protein ACPD28_000509 [Pasteurella multocida]
MNVLEIYRKNPDTVFITRGGTKVKVKNIRPYVVIVESLDGSGKTQYSVDGTNGYFLGSNNPDPLDIIGYEQPQIFTVGEYVTRDGCKATIYHDLSESFKMCYPLFGYIDGNEDYDTWTKCGEGVMGEVMPYDLVGPWVESPYTITVNGKKFHPVKNPEDGKRHFYVSVATQTVAHSTTWNVKNPNLLDALLVNLNLVYQTVEEAQAFLNEIIKPNAEIRYET